MAMQIVQMTMMKNIVTIWNVLVIHVAQAPHSGFSSRALDNDDPEIHF